MSGPTDKRYTISVVLWKIFYRFFVRFCFIYIYNIYIQFEITVLLCRVLETKIRGENSSRRTAGRLFSTVYLFFILRLRNAHTSTRECVYYTAVIFLSLRVVYIYIACSCFVRFRKLRRKIRKNKTTAAEYPEEPIPCFDDFRLFRIVRVECYFKCIFS